MNGTVTGRVNGTVADTVNGTVDGTVTGIVNVTVIGTVTGSVNQPRRLTQSVINGVLNRRLNGPKSPRDRRTSTCGQ